MFDLLLLSPRQGRYAYFADGKLWATDVVSAGAKIYRVKVTRRAPSLGGVFADAGDCSVLVRCKEDEMPREGDYLFVWEAEPPKDGKLAVCRLHPTLAERHVVYLPDDDAVHFAKGVPEATRDHYRAVLPKGVGCILRTAVRMEDQAEVTASLAALTAKWREICTHVGVGLVHEEPLDPTKYAAQATQTHCDDERTACRFGYRYVPDLEADLARAAREAEGLGRTVCTPEGVQLVFDHTEACTVVDVNSGKWVSDAPAEAAAYAVNRIAAAELVRQLCLRDVTGAVLVDFVNMTADYARRFLAELKQMAERDTRLHIVGLTKLGFAEMTRSVR